MAIHIISREILNTPGSTRKEEIREGLENAIKEFQTEVNNFCSGYQTPLAITILQSSGASGFGSFTQLTAIITIP